VGRRGLSYFCLFLSISRERKKRVENLYARCAIINFTEREREFDRRAKDRQGDRERKTGRQGERERERQPN
jgi:hypothetical protein